MNVKGKRVLVMGLGLHGGALGTVKWLHGQGARVTVTDTKTADELANTLQKLEQLPDIAYTLGGHKESDFDAADLIIRNPAVPKNSPYLLRAREKGIPVEMDSSLFFMNAQTTDIIGITGSKGKTTTSRAIASLLSSFADHVVCVGVDGASPLQALPYITKKTTVVFELSSWRLEALLQHKKSPPTGVLTALYRDHLNTYNSFSEYIDTKKTIFRFQSKGQAAILNYDDPNVRAVEKDVPGSLYWYSLHSFPDKEGIFLDGEAIMVRLGSREARICGLSDIPVSHPHHIRNMLPAIFIAHMRGAPPERIQEGVRAIKPLAHRLERVRIHNGVEYVNDSAATIPDATIAALAAYADRPVTLIAGGGDKSLDFSGLQESLSKTSLRSIIFLPGTATAAMQAVIPQGIPTEKAPTMQEAVSKASALSKPGDTVLLSPGATSFGLFRHEFDRGDQFRQCVLNLS